MVLSMGFRSMALFLAILASLQVLSIAAVYKVGDSAGWTTIGNIDYKKWAASKSFQLGDIILFEYSPQFHNVMQVNHSAYRACNTSAPIATHTSGNDSINITAHGHHFFFCGVPGHCQSGQKVDINVIRTPLAPTPSAPPSPSTPSAPSPSHSAAALYSTMGLLGKLGLSMAVFAALVSGFA